jgi:hypothetical protein
MTPDKIFVAGSCPGSDLKDKNVSVAEVRACPPSTRIRKAVEQVTVLIVTEPARLGGGLGYCQAGLLSMHM